MPINPYYNNCPPRPQCPPRPHPNANVDLKLKLLKDQLEAEIAEIEASSLSDSATIDIIEAEGKTTANVIISSAENNQLSVSNEGLYVPPVNPEDLALKVAGEGLQVDEDDGTISLNLKEDGGLLLADSTGELQLDPGVLAAYTWGQF